MFYPTSWDWIRVAVGINTGSIRFCFLRGKTMKGDSVLLPGLCFSTTWDIQWINKQSSTKQETKLYQISKLWTGSVNDWTQTHSPSLSHSLVLLKEQELFIITINFLLFKLIISDHSIPWVEYYSLQEGKNKAIILPFRLNRW